MPDLWKNFHPQSHGGGAFDGLLPSLSALTPWGGSEPSLLLLFSLCF
jgi:hypothetical protein